MKAFLITDTHFGVHPLQLHKWLDMQKEYFDKFFIPLVKKKSSKGDIIVHLGDYFDNRTALEVSVLDFGIKLMEQLSALLPVHLLLGNHDLYTLKTRDCHSMRWAKYMPNVHLYEEPKMVEFDGKTSLMLPWVESHSDMASILSNLTKVDHIFCHSDLKGAKGNLKAKPLEHGVELESFSKVGNVWSGHIHLRQQMKNFLYLGSPYHLDRNDKDNKKGVYILDFKTGETEFVPNNISPEYKTIIVTKEEDLDLSAEELSNNFIDITVSSSLLINNPKIKTKLEKMIEKGSFAKFDVQDDLKLENIITEQMDLSEIGINLDFERLAEDHIESQEIDKEIKDRMKRIVKELFGAYQGDKDF